MRFGIYYSYVIACFDYFADSLQNMFDLFFSDVPNSFIVVAYIISLL